MLKVSLDRVPILHEKMYCPEIQGLILRNHICYVCLCVAIEPMGCSLCKQVYCETCLRGFVNVQIEHCPKCRKPS